MLDHLRRVREFRLRRLRPDRGGVIGTAGQDRRDPLSLWRWPSSLATIWSLPWAVVCPPLMSGLMRSANVLLQPGAVVVAGDRDVADRAAGMDPVQCRPDGKPVLGRPHRLAGSLGLTASDEVSFTAPGRDSPALATVVPAVSGDGTGTSRRVLARPAAGVGESRWI